ncbi:CBS domain-containing protein [Dyella solisilvae]|uniref:CBS domain-containing protein n=1 Tax=Dyella solisilvae TaxID=1920168 RepID=A0A370K496_9GAMM|nr:CBS domain-containing protein [Dyella solisilvae]RDI97483.1 CBS domain-containing protein [Dyella solisilvae]
MNVGDAMTYQVRTALVSDPVSLAMRIMLGAKVSGLPVVDGKGHLVGILTESDLLRRAEIDTQRKRPRWLEIVLGPRRLAQEYVDTHSRRVGDLMTTDVVTVDESQPLADAVCLMEKRNFKRVPVTRDGHLIGMLSRADLLRVFLSALPPEGAALAVSDTDIRQRIDEEMLRNPWITRSAIRVSVNEGRVDLDGVVTNDAMRDALRVLVENVPGVVGVKDKLTFVGQRRGYL